MTIPVIRIDRSSPVPPYLQIAEQLKRLIGVGTLAPGARLPAVRDLAADVGVNRNTASRAIRQLEAAGLVRTRVGQGTFVADLVARIDGAARERIVDEAIDRLLVEASTVGMPLEMLGWRLAQRIDDFVRKRGREANDD